MAKQSNILGAFSGRVGPVVGSTWRGIPVMRTRPAYKKNRRSTPAQELQRAKFSLASSFLVWFKPLLEESFEFVAGKTGMNFAISHLLNHAIQGTPPNLSIDYASVLLAKGSLKNVSNSVVKVVGSNLVFTWTDNTGMGNASASDQAILVMYHVQTNSVHYTMDGGSRSSGEGVLDVAMFAGKEVHAWISFRAAGGELKGDSVYCGVVKVKT